MDELVSMNLGKYQIIDELGRGGMGTVYRAYDPSLRRHVAIKVLLPKFAYDQDLVARFQREAFTAANLRHPNIVIIHDVGTVEPYHYIVMELLAGLTLHQELRGGGPMPLSRVSNMVTQLASGLDFAHTNGIIHRDVKPANVIVGLQDHVTLTDFGLVKAIAQQDTNGTGGGAAVGTLTYMAPEQLIGESIDQRSDVYSLGVVAYEMLTGHTPFQAETPYQIIQSILYQAPPPPSQFVPGATTEVDTVLLKALAKSPEARYATAGEFARALHRLRPPVGLTLVGPDGRRYALRPSGCSIGRGPDNDIVVQTNEISRYHAFIRCQASSWFITDLDSTNGSFVNGTRLAPQVAHPLNAGDIVQLGGTFNLWVQETEGPDERLAHTTNMRMV